MWFKREIEHYLGALANQRACLVITGARQTGKSSLLEHLFPRATRVSLDLPSLAQEADSNGQEFLRRLGTPCIIDEVQHAPGLFRYLKAAIDASQKKPGCYFLTGSEKFSLMEGVSESLSGRASIIELHSLSVSELESNLGIKARGEKLWEFIFLGGYPELHASSIPREQFFSDYVATYIDRDARRVLNIKNIRQFDQFIRILSSRVGQLLSLNSLAGDIGISPTTAGEWLNVLVITNIIALVEPWHLNATKRVVKSPKVYFLDTGLGCYLAGLRSTEDLLASPMKGAWFENHVFSEMLRWHWNRGQQLQIYFFRDYVGNEVDFLTHHGGRFELFECKASADPDISIKGFTGFSQTFPKSKYRAHVVTTEREHHRQKQVAGHTIQLKDSIDWKISE